MLKYFWQPRAQSRNLVSNGDHFQWFLNVGSEIPYCQRDQQMPASINLLSVTAAPFRKLFFT